jgi:ubiquinone biosynthesis protein UbiJ
VFGDVMGVQIANAAAAALRKARHAARNLAETAADS